MNEYEVTKLRKQLQRSQDVIDELRSDLDFTERKLVEVQAVVPLQFRSVIGTTPKSY